MEKRKKKGIIKNTITDHIKINLKEYVIVLSILMLGITIGVVFVNKLSENQISELNLYITSFVDLIKGNNEVDTVGLLQNSIKQNVTITILLWFVGSTVIGLPIVYGIVAFRGFCLGYTVSAIVAILGTSKGMIFTMSTMLLQNIIVIPCILALAVSGTKLYKSIMKDRRKENVKFEIIKHTIFSGIIGLGLISSSFVEVYISTNLFRVCLNFI